MHFIAFRINCFEVTRCFECVRAIQLDVSSGLCTCFPLGFLETTAAKLIQQAERMWAGRAGRGVIGRAAGAPWWPPTHSANEHRASRTRGPSGHRRDVASLTEKNTRFDLLRTPGFFLFGRVIIRERVEVLTCDGGFCVQVYLCSVLVYYGVVYGVRRGVVGHRHKVPIGS